MGAHASQDSGGSQGSQASGGSKSRSSAEWWMPAACTDCNCDANEERAEAFSFMVQPWFADQGDDQDVTDRKLLKEKLTAGKAIETSVRIFIYPQGVAAVRLRSYGYSQSMRALPQAAADLMIEKGAQEQYAEFSAALSAAPVLPWKEGGGLDPSSVAETVATYNPIFQGLGISVHLCASGEDTSAQQPAEVVRRHSRWLVFVDRDELPDFQVENEMMLTPSTVSTAGPVDTGLAGMSPAAAGSQVAESRPPEEFGAL
eukprot:TRINITY_DN29497_c0_g2_i1.p1 TRINITY_DN29497_c0_g2~~TRINITY_DN29497_c0_g2_i1.p1  ORF type:complete len:258 (-),score=47.99 TRINITY_DN29497_c0_g2_i1:59-832(-)